ncbi:hypothetical protein [Dyadobacter tibetensis]|nr:hypothetical protein [Dyadobacter tibetensis]
MKKVIVYFGVSTGATGKVSYCWMPNTETLIYSHIKNPNLSVALIGGSN